MLNGLQISFFVVNDSILRELSALSENYNGDGYCKVGFCTNDICS